MLTPHQILVQTGRLDGRRRRGRDTAKGSHRPQRVGGCLVDGGIAADAAEPDAATQAVLIWIVVILKRRSVTPGTPRTAGAARETAAATVPTSTASSRTSRTSNTATGFR